MATVKARPTVPALVLGSGITALGVLRSLGRESIPTFYAPDKPDFVARSRWARVVETGLGEFSGPDELAAALERLDAERMVLVPCSDSWVRTVAQLDRRFDRRFPRSVATVDNLDVLADKQRFAERMTQSSIPHPKTTPLPSRAALESLPESEFLHGFLKPCDSQSFSAHFQQKALMVDSREHALERYDAIANAGHDVVLQEYVPGPPTNHFYVDAFVDRNGRTLTRFARQRLRMHSPFSNSSCLRSIPLAAAREACSIMDRIIDALQPVRGMLSAELKLDDRDGALKVIEVNARAWKHVEFAATCGVNICRLAYDDALGAESEPIQGYLDNETCVDLYYDLPHCWRLYRRREITLGEWIGSVWGAKGPVVAIDDPLPAVSRFGQLARASMRRRIRTNVRAR